MKKLEDARRMVYETNGKIFTAFFYKKDGTLRKMNCRLGVKKHLQGGEYLHGHGNKYPQYVPVYDLKVRGYRTLNLDTIQSINFRGVEIVF